VSDAAETHFAYVGSRTTRERGASGEGIAIFAVDAAASRWRHLDTVGGLVNPSFLALRPGGGTLYAVHGDGTEVSAFALNPASGTLSLVNRVSCGGTNPAHLVVHPNGRFLFVANHLSSNVAAIAIAEDGALGELVQLLPLPGEPGPHRKEQPFSKPHQLVFDPHGRFLIVPDKGIDATFFVAVDAATGRLALTGEPARDREGSGPRHAVVAPGGGHVYVVNELDSTVAAFSLQGEGLVPIQRLNALPDDFFGFSRAAGIAITPDGRLLFASNRGHDSIAAFSVDQATGRLTALGHEPSGGRTPRFIAPSPDASAIICANEEGHTLTRIAIDENGRLQPAREVAVVRSPVCVAWLRSSPISRERASAET
jgi:6-phosphogluconolactonase (cycloisomerase 2 family)